MRVLACGACGLWMLDAPGSATERQAIYTERYFEGWGFSPQTAERIQAMKRKTFERAFAHLARYGRPGRLLDVGCAFGASLEVAQAQGWDVYGLEMNPYAVKMAQQQFGSQIMRGDFESVRLEEHTYDAIVLWDVLEHLPDPRSALNKANRLLRAEGLVMINTPSTASLSAKVLRGLWPQLKAEHLCYLSPGNLTGLLDETGFRALAVVPSVKALNLRYVNEIMTRYPVAGLSGCVRALSAIAPSSLRDLNVYVRTGEMFAIARTKPVP